MIRTSHTPADDCRGHRQRLKQRFSATALQGWRDDEALELLLGYAIARRDVKPLARRLVSRFGSLRAVLEAPEQELCATAGIGPHCVILLHLVRELCARYLRTRIENGDIVSSPQQVIDYCNARMATLPCEQFRVLYLDARNAIICDEIAQQGTVNQTAVYPREIVQRALETGAVALLFVHNHPSGACQPSAQDRRLTERLVEAARLLGITVHDHLIIGRGGHFSFRTAGLL